MEYEQLFPNERLRQARHRKAWTQSDLAEALGTDFETVSRWERGITIPSPYYREKLGEVLGQSAQELGLISSPSVPIPSLSAPLVFLSSSHADAERGTMQELKAHLQARGIMLWSSRSVRRSSLERRTHALQEAIRAASVVLVIASPEARASRHVRETLKIARIYRCLVCAVWIEGEDLQKSLPEDCGKLFATIDARKKHDPSALDAIEDAVEKALGASGDKGVALPNHSSDPPAEPRNPYKGLRAYRREDRQDFFGRDPLIDQLTAALETSLNEGKQSNTDVRLLPLIGPSGSGKSSLVMAGLLPCLQAGGLPGSEEWVYLGPMVPGTHPLESLALIFAERLPGKSLGTIREDLDYDSARGLHLLATTLAKGSSSGTRVVLFVDQFEELFTQTSDEAERQGFIDVLVTAITEPHGPLIVILTLRADFYDRPMHYPELGTLLQQYAKPVLPMEVQDLQAVIECPAALADVRLAFEGSLAGDLLFEIQGQPGALPLLQFTLDQLFQRRDEHLLTLQAYREIGGVKGALAQHAESVYAALPSEEHRQFARTLFLRLIDPGVTEQDTTRSRATPAHLSLPDALQTQRLQETAAAFIAGRLITSSSMAGVPTLEVSHEALIREWKRLAEWLRGARGDILLQKAISEDAADWQRRGVPVDRLYRGSQLTEAQVWAERNMPSSDEVDFLQASAAEHERQRGVERAQQAREQALQQRAAKWQRNVIGMMTLTTVVLVVALVVALVFQGQLQTTLANLQRSLPVSVTSLNDSGPGTLRQAIATAEPGSVITFARNLSGTLRLTSGELKITKNLTISGPGAALLSVSAGNTGSAFHVSGDVLFTITNLTIKQSRAANGGGIDIDQGGTAILTNSIISHNESYDNGGGIYNEGTLILTNSIVTDNTADMEGGGIYNAGTLLMTASIISRNASANSGGGIYIRSADSAPFPGLFYAFESSPFAAPPQTGGALTLVNSTITGNRANENGGGIYSDGGDLSLTTSTVSNNTASRNGGGIFNTGIALTLFDSTISGNTASWNGGGIYNGDDLQVGAIGQSTLSLINSTISGNTAKGDGGGIASAVGYSLLLDACTIYGNTAAIGGGLAIETQFKVPVPAYALKYGPVLPKAKDEMVDCIVAGDRAGKGPDIWGALTLYFPSLIQNASGARLSFDMSLSSYEGSNTLAMHSLIGKSPDVGPLQYNGGPTQTHALLPGSPAIDQIPLFSFNGCGGVLDAIPHTDQRGIQRPQGSRCDIGSYEYVPSR